MMKKSLVALAALAVVGAASAQSTVTITGKYAFAYEGTSTGGRVSGTSISKNGFATTDGNVVFAATEDLGGGLKAGASMDLRLRGRSAANAVNGRDAFVFVSGGFGTVMGGTAEASLISYNPAGAPTIGLDGNTIMLGGSRAVVDGAATADLFSYTSPVFAGGFKVNLTLADSIDAPGAYGMESNPTAAAAQKNTAQDATTIGGEYSSGPLTVKADYTKYSKNDTAGFGVLDALGASTAMYNDVRTRLMASYDFGVAKLGFGYQTKTLKDVAAVPTVGDVGNRQYQIGVSAPVGASTLVGFNYTRNTQDAVKGVASNTITAWDLGAQYNLSKRTNIMVGYQRVSEENFADAASKYRVRLLHSF